MRMARIGVLGLAATLVLSSTAALTQGQSNNSKPELHSRYDMRRALVECLGSLRVPECHLGIQLTVRLTFNAHGGFEGRPRFTYVTPDLPNEAREKYEKVIVETLERCTPLNFSRDFGSGIAGTPLLLRLTRGRSC
jgi:hypothetical protein